ncbi:MAG: biotin carboxylase N-terminal domain-containing protein [Actinomycetota bacterium]|nr:biotin carboxylase N-terminal domain-containing protein [Actinomycetota bacterium]
MSPPIAPTPIRSVLVANRGEIARRVFRTARSMGMRCIAVFVDADADAPFVQEADEAVRLPDSYLDAEAVLAAAQRTGAEAIHPGYGFLSENAAFARAVTEAGIRWVGPSPDVIESMGDKIAAKRVAVEAGVPTLPSSEDPAADTPTIEATVGYPLLVKASAGGGGKGMRIVESAVDLADAVQSAQREALSGFGDETVFLERYVASSRHVEIQILGDAHGNVVHLGERECSIQRRHQKIVEESPSPIIDAEMRTAMGEAALSLARHMGYESAGTVEFLVDDVTREFFFLEVNTRLQVEHPVPEEVTGIDLVREQLRVAGGAELGYDQGDIDWTGSAIEVRLYAEDPDNDFLPATGTLSAYRPADEPTVRWDSGVEEGSVVGVDFDPMLAQVIAHAPTRAEAAGRLALALERMHLGGVVTNRDFLVATLRNEAFLAGDTTTDFIERVDPAGSQAAPDTAIAAIVAAMWIQGRNRADDRVWGFARSNFRTGSLPPQSIEFETATDETHRIEYSLRRNGGFTLGSGDTVLVHEWTPDDIELEIDGRRLRAAVTVADGVGYVTLGRTTVTLPVKPRFAIPGSELPTGGLVAPMPGSVIELRCAIGDTVAADQVLVVLEAMKMEHHITAPFDGTVTELPIAVGDQVENGALLLTIEESADD